jgi:lysophospholipase L1-like esterase
MEVMLYRLYILPFFVLFFFPIGATHTMYDRVVDDGIVAEKTEAMKARLQRSLPLFKKDPDMFVLLGGTNDVIIVPAEKSVENLMEMVDRMLRVPNAKVVVLTVPDHPSEKAIKRVRERRMFVNGELRKKFGKGGEESSDRVVLVDIAKCLPQYVIESEASHHTNPHPVLPDMWDPDRLHFSPLGYDRVGELVFEHITAAEWA